MELKRNPQVGSDGKKSVRDHTGAKPATNNGPWDPALEKLREWDPKWAETCVKMTTNPWTRVYCRPRPLS